MALVNADGKYIKMMPYGEFSVYPDEETRMRQKNAPATLDIINRYMADLSAMDTEMKRLYEDGNTIDLEELKVKYDYVSHEFNDFSNDLSLSKGARHEYPYMGQFFDNVADAIPNIVESGILPLEIEDVVSLYETVKEERTFGETQDV